jgi:hypothetical protein
MLLAAAAIGGGLGVWGHRLTRFEATPEGLFYTPSAHLGIAISLLFIGRVAYRLVQLWTMGGMARDGHVDFVRSPLTLAIFGVMAGYYVAYAIGLIRWRAAVRSVENAGRPGA